MNTTSHNTSLSEQVAVMEEELRCLKASKAKTEEVVSAFIADYDSSDHISRLPADRDYHTFCLKELLKFIA